jgi:hypothetical protein
VTDEVTVDSPGKVVERGLDGRVIQQGAVPVLANEIDFDGDRFAYPLRPCELSDIVVTSSLAQAVPPELPTRCPVPRFPTSKIYLRHRHLTTRVVCPAQPYLGCAGSLQLLARARGGKLLGYANYAFDPGQSGSLSARLGRRARQFLIRHPRLGVIARATSVKPFGEGTPYRPTVAQTALAVAR